ncbi:MAG: COR domain-containing protein [Saprospiraceae bacterium]
MQNANTSNSDLSRHLSQPLYSCADWAEFLRSGARNTCLADENGNLLALDVQVENQQVLDLSAFDLRELRWLNVSETEGLTSLLLPDSMPELVRLDASRCALAGIDLPADAFSRQFLGDMPRTVPSLYLQKNKLQSVRFRGACRGLELMDLSGNEMTVFHLPAGFDRLTYLYLNNNSDLADLAFYAPPRLLDTLHLRGCKLDLLPHNVLSFGNLDSLYLHSNPLSSLKPGVVPAGEYDNAWPAVRAYFEELAQGMVTNERVKIIVVGNGRVGKTSLLRRLGGEPFNAREPYTHGIRLGTLDKSKLPDVHTAGLQAQVWDFGGQEIFYATHQFFLSEDALYILAWTHEDNVRPHRERDVSDLPDDERFQPNEYWLENIRHRGGTKCPIVMVQTHYKVKRSTCNEDDLLKNYGALCFNFDAAEENLGLSDIRAAICQKLKSDIPFLGGDVPASYDRCIGILEKLRGQPPRMTKADFEREVCAAAGVLPGNETEALGYLHRTGAVVWFSGEKDLKDTVFTDPNWLTEQVYRLINNELRTTSGCFDAEYLLRHLPAFTEAERVQFLELLKTFGLIFETKKEVQEEGHNKIKTVFIAPNYLPEVLSSDALTLLNSHQRALTPAFRFAFPRFMPDNVMVNFLSRYGPYSDQLYWKNGIFFTNEIGHRALVKREGNTLDVLAETGEAARILTAEICHAFAKLSGNANAELRVADRTVSWQALTKAVAQGAEDVPDVDGNYTKVAHFAHLLGGGDGMPHRGALQLVKPTVYLSYAWADTQETGESREAIVRDLIAALEQDGRFELKYDKQDATYRRSIAEFEREIGRAERIAVVVSDKYLKSVHCMYELLQIFRKSGSEAVAFREKIFPIVQEDAKKIYDEIDRLDYVEYWQEKCQKLEEKINRLGLTATRDAVKDFDKYSEIMTSMGRLAGVIADLNTLSPHLLSANNFEEIKRALLEKPTYSP